MSVKCVKRLQEWMDAAAADPERTCVLVCPDIGVPAMGFLHEVEHRKEEGISLTFGTRPRVPQASNRSRPTTTFDTRWIDFNFGDQLQMRGDQMTFTDEGAPGIIGFVKVSCQAELDVAIRSLWTTDTRKSPQRWAVG